jgi:hypothetical protein
LDRGARKQTRDTETFYTDEIHSCSIINERSGACSTRGSAVKCVHNSDPEKKK